MASMLDKLVRKYAKPVLEAADFEAIRPRVFMKASGDSSIAAVAFERTSGRPPAELFYLEGRVMPWPDVEWRRFARQAPLDGADLAMADGRYFRRFPPSEAVDAQPPERSTHQYWLLHPSEAPVDECGAYVEQRLREEVVPLLERLLDPRELLAAQRARTPGVERDKMTEILLRLPDGDTPELRAAIEDLAGRSEHWAHSEFIAWARNRLAAMRAGS